MKYRITTIICLLLASITVALVAAQTANTGNASSPSGAQAAQAVSPQKADKAKKVHLPPNFSADDAYKQNCTRCHAEVPPVNARRMNTIVRHMRVRANLSQDEAQAILQYLTQ